MATAIASTSGINFQSGWAELDLPPHVREVLASVPLVQSPETRPQFLDWALGSSTGTTDWTLGNSHDHGVYEAVFLDPLGQRIIDACFDGANQRDCRRLIPHPKFRDDES
jgi:hypothetical protein